jgi:hypothetical protein
MSEITPFQQCRYKEIGLIQKYIKLWNIKINKLPKVQYNNSIINYNDINIFINKNRCENDKNNKKREAIIGCIINNKLSPKYYKYSLRWNKLKKIIASYIKKLCDNKNITNCYKLECIHKAGRKHHYDFKIVINNNIEFNIEFKFNAVCLNDTPQFVSPMKPSQYLEDSYEEFYYDNYFIKLVNYYNLYLPTKKEYLKQIHSPNPPSLKTHQEKYYSGCKQSSKYSGNKNDINFYEDMKKKTKESIYNFISLYDVKKEKLSDYLLNTQKDKYYMLYKDNCMYLQTINQDDYIITEIIKEQKYSRYIAKTKTGNKLKILLRWKNGNGIAYPSFQIS